MLYDHENERSEFELSYNIFHSRDLLLICHSPELKMYVFLIHDIEGVHSKKPHFKNVMEITNMNLRKMLWYQMKPNMVP